jgi:hypothetical protein
MTTSVESLVATTYDALAAALAKTCLIGAPIARSKSTDRAIEALAGYALGVFVAQVSTRLALGADLSRATAIRTALFRESGKVSPAMARVDVDAIVDDDRLITAVALRARVAGRLRASRADCTRIIAAMVAASGGEPAWLARVLADLARGDLVAVRFADRVEQTWAQLHDAVSFTSLPANSNSAVAMPDYYVVEIR